MRNAFAHLLPLNEIEVEKFWNEATLTVDANVLLDLYRVHHETRNALISALRNFQGRLWISHQAASEFIRNRGHVALSVGRDFSDADGDLKVLEAAVRKATVDLQNRRLLPIDVSKKLTADIEAAIRVARSGIEEVHDRHTNGALTDEVLEAVLSLFDGCVGAPPGEEELKEAENEGKRRIKEKVPPGYEDAKKGGKESYGDYLLWHQLLQHAKASEKPVILVTSERKEDWWERVHGKTLGPRQELLEEAHRVAGQRVIIYQTRSFVEHATERAGAVLPRALLNDISSPRDDRELEDLVTIAVEELGSDLIDQDSAINSLIAETNAFGWSVDQAEVTDLGPLDYQTCSAPFTASIYFSGDQDEDRIYFGHSITAKIQGTVVFENGDWTVSEHEILEAEIDRDDEDEPDEDVD